MSEIVDCITFIVRKTCWSLAVFIKFITLRFFDLLGLIFNVLACLTIVRLPAMIAQFQDLSNMTEWRFIGLVQLIIFLTDIPIFIMGCIVLFTLWRVYPCLNELKEVWNGKFKYAGIYYTGFKVRGVIVKHFFTLFIDAVCVPTAIICVLSWRSCIFINKMRAAPDDWKRRKICFKEFLQVLVDIPLILCFVISICSWRLPFLIVQIKKDRNENKTWTKSIRYIGIENILYLFMDIPCIIMFIITFCSWRVVLLLRRVDQVKLNESLWKPKIQHKVRKEISIEFLLVFCDIPSIIVAFFVAITIWRFPTLYGRIKRVLHQSPSNIDRKSESSIREKCFQEFGMLFVDIFCFILFLLILITLWRVYPVITDMREYMKRYRLWKVEEERKNGNLQAAISSSSANLRETEIIEKTVVLSRNEANQNNDENISVNGAEAIQSGEQDNNDSVNSNVVLTNVNPLTEQTASDEPLQSQFDVPVLTENVIKTLSWSKCSWKIRKLICMNFVMLLVDIPAIVLFVFLLVTILRARKVLSAVIGGGNFYMLFAVTVYHQTLRFFIDLAFILLFLVLSVLRPIQLWVCLLEDEEHMKYRILCDDILPWGPDIANDRADVYRQLNDAVSIAIKENTPYSRIHATLVHILDSHLDRISDLIEKMKNNELEDEYINILTYIEFYENNRWNKLLRKHQMEINFLQRPDVRLHDANTAKLKHEMQIYENKLKPYYEQLKTYKPTKVPLYEEKSGLSIRSRQETKQVLIKCLPRGRFAVLIMALLSTIPLYRAPNMFMQLYNRWYNRFNIITKTLKEYALDLLTLLQIIFVLALVYRAPFLIVDIADCLVERRSWKAVRNVVKKYPPNILDDLVSLISGIFSWNTPRLIFTTFLFAILMPADLYLTVTKIWLRNKIAYLLTFIIYAFFTALPFVIVYYISGTLLENDKGSLIMVIIAIFYVLLLTILAISILNEVFDETRDYLLEVPPCDYIRYSWYNIHLVLFEILEFLQGVALVFKIINIPMYGSETLHEASKYLLFSFFSFEVVFWITVVLFVIWFLICGAPIILEIVLSQLPVGTCGKRSSWRIAVSIFANTLFLTMVENFMSFTGCYYYDCPKSFVNMTSANITIESICLPTILVDDSTMECWSNEHIPYALFGFIGLVWYSTTALIFTTKYGDPNTSEQDIGFSPVYNTVINIFKAIMILSVTVVTNNEYISLGILILFNLISVVFTLSFRTMFQYQPTNVMSFLVWRLFAFVSTIIAAVAVLVAFVMNDWDSKLPVIILGCGIFVMLVISIIVAIKLLKESQIVKDRSKFRAVIIKLEQTINKNNWFIETWISQSKTWKRLSKSVTEASKNDRKLNPENWNIDDIFITSEPGILNEQTSTIEYAPPPLPSGEFTSPPLDSEEGLVNYNPPALLPGGDETLVINDSVPTKNSENLTLTANVPEINYGSIDDTENASPPPSPPPPPSYNATVNNELYSTNTKEANQEISQLSYNVIKLEKNGRNLLLMFEKHIHYFAYKYSFISQRNHWLNAVWDSNWTGLLHCLEILESNLKGSYNRPSQLDINLSPKALPQDELQDDPHDVQELPEKVKKLTKQERIDISQTLRRKAIEDVKSVQIYGEQWSIVFDKLLPTLPFIINWSYEPNGSFTLTSSRSCTGVITEIENNGNKLAKGASFTIGKVLSGFLTEDNGLVFNTGNGVTGKKGPVSVKVSDVKFLMKNDVIYLQANGKKVKYDVAMASCKTIHWK